MEKLKNTLDKGGFVCVMFMYLSKAFDTIDDGFLIAKLVAYGFQEHALAFMKSYLRVDNNVFVSTVTLVSGKK